MSVATWQAGNLYLPGSLVSPSTVSPIVRPAIANAGFELGDSDWNKSTNVTIVEDALIAFNGSWYAQFIGSATVVAGSISSAALIPVTPGNEITLKAVCDLGAGTDSEAYLQLNFYSDLAYTLVSLEKGDYLTEGNDGEWKNISISTTVPSSAIYVEIVASALSTTGTIRFDNFSWDYVESGSNAGLIFKATQAASGLSGTEEPTWPTVAGGTVVDNEITWEAVEATTVVWQARPILTSGDTEPTWPTTTGALVSDNNISWECVRLHIDDPNCPQTREVAIGASKIFAGDEDITRFSATLNPRDWSSFEDAGFLPSGQHQGEEVGVSAIGVYRGNLAIWSPSSFQIWQIDPDPAAMALLDAMEGIGSFHHKAVQPVSDDLFFLASLGVRTVGVAAASTNLATGDAGIPIDILVQEDLKGSVDPIATFYQSMGQYWLAFPPRTSSIPGEVEPPPTDPPFEPPIEPDNCNEVWEIGVLRPDLHVAGYDVNIDDYNNGVIIGIGTVEDSRFDPAFLFTAEGGDYVKNSPYDVAYSYYPGCQGYAYSGRQLYGRLVHNWDMDGISWTDIGSPIHAQRTGLDGVTVNGSTCTDNSASETSGVIKLSPLSATITYANKSILNVLTIEKQTGISNYARFIFRPKNRSDTQIVAIFSAETGSILIDTDLSTTDAVAEVRDTGNWWEVYLQVNTQEPIQVLQMQIYIYPAWNNDGTTTADVTATGLIDLGWTNIFSWYSSAPNQHTIDMYRGLALEVVGSVGSVIDESYITIDAANFDGNEGGVYIEWRPMYSHDEVTSTDPLYTQDVQILSLNDGLGLLYYDWTNELLTSTDGVNTATVPLNLVKKTKYRLGVVFGDGKLRVGVDGVWGAEVSYAGSFPTSADWSILGEPFRINYWRELRGYHTDIVSAKTEITLLMNGAGGGYDPTPQLPPEIEQPYWDNMEGNGWIDLTLCTQDNFLNRFGTTIEAADFDGEFSVGGSATPVATLFNTLDGGNRMAFTVDSVMTHGVIMVVATDGVVLDSVVYDGTANDDYVTLPTGADYYIVTSTDTGLATVEKWDTTNATVPIDLAGTVSWKSVFGTEFGEVAATNRTFIIPAEGIAIAFTVPVTDKVGGFSFSAIEVTGVSTTKTGTVNQTALDFNNGPSHVWGTGGGIAGGINGPDEPVDFAAAPGQTYIWNMRNDIPYPANWIKLRTYYTVG